MGELMGGRRNTCVTGNQHRVKGEGWETYKKIGDGIKEKGFVTKRPIVSY